MSDKVPDGWKKYKLEEVAKIVGGGTPRTDIDEYWNGDIPWITPKDLSNFNGRYISKGERSITKKGLINSSAKLLPPGTILLTSRAPVGYLAIAKNEITTNQGFRSLIPSDNVDNLFLFYLLKNNIKYLKFKATGTTFEELNGSVLGSLVFLFPPIAEQRAIASVLSSLDDKIDLLHRENKTLEAMAETLFRKWFIEEAEDDWEGVSLGDSTLSTIIKSGINFFEGEKFYLETNDVNNTDIVGGIPVTYADRPSRANMEPVVYSVWFSKKQGTRKLLMFDEYSKYTNKLILSTGFTGLKTTELSHYYIWCYVMSPQFQKIKDNLVTGSVQPDITNDNVKKIIIPKPDNETLLKFNSVVKEFFYKISLNQVQIRTLTQLRDTLLPKLMSGEVRVDLCQS